MAENKDTTLATISMVLGILSLVCLGPLAAIPAVICGHIAMGKISRGEAEGEGMAKAGLIMGYISIVLNVLAFIAWLVLFGVAVAGAAAQGAQEAQGFLLPF
jgi:hypothetical protein